METIELIALSLGLAWASGINLYAAVAVLGLLGASGSIALPPGLEVTQHPAVIAAAAFMYCVEFFADKVPGVDTAWDALHAFVRIPAAAVLAAAAVYHVDPAIALAAALLGGAVGTASYAVKAGSRLVVNTSPEPFSNIGASLAEDVAVLAGMAAALFAPTAFLVLLGLFAALALWSLPRLWRGLRALASRLRGRPLRAAAPTEGLSPSPGQQTAITE